MTEPEYFARVYADSPDPWHLGTSAYEHRKYAATVAALGDRRFDRAFEPGCSIGVLTEALSHRCDELVAWDLSPVAVGQARTRVPAATVEVGAVPAAWPPGRFVLVVLSELVYYLDVGDRARVAELARDCLTAGGLLLAVHWHHRFAEASCDGDTVHDELVSTPGLASALSQRDDDVRLDVLQRA